MALKLKKLAWKPMFGSRPYDVNTNNIEQASTLSLHTHDFPQICWVEKACCIHTINKKSLQLKRGDLMLIRPTDIHAFRPVGKAPYTLYFVSFRADILAWFKKRYFAGNSDFWGGQSAVPQVYNLDEPELAYLHDQMNRLLAGPRARMQIDRFLLNLFALAPLSMQPRDTDQSIPDWLQKACTAIRTRECFVEGVTAFIRLSNRCHEHVARETKRLLGKSPSDIVNEARVQYAAKLLGGTGMSILQIALESGFSNAGHFHRVFRHVINVSPGEYRKSMKRAVV